MRKEWSATNEKEISELRRRLRNGRNNLTTVCGCYVNEHREILSEFSESLLPLPEDEVEKILTLFRKSLSGTLGKNLVDLSFPTQSVVSGPEHHQLMALRDGKLQDPEAVHALYQSIAETLSMDTSYLILLGYDTYDVPFRGRDDAEFSEASAEVFRYLICSVCPVKQTKPALSFQIQENCFRNIGADWIIAPPEVGFLFPAFDDRATNIYGALYYTRNPADNHPDLVQRIFAAPLLMSAAEQKTAFQTILSESAGEACSYQVVQAVQDQLTVLMEEHKENHIRDPLRISCSTVKGILQSCGIPEPQRDQFEQRYQEEFGADTALAPRNLIDPKRMQVTMPDISIQINPEHSELVETRVIDGVRYILIRAEEGVEVNGVPIHIS